MAKLFIYRLYNNINLGDDNNALGIQKRLVNFFKPKDVVMEANALFSGDSKAIGDSKATSDPILSQFKKKGIYIFIAAGAHHLSKLAQLRIRFNFIHAKGYFIWASHQRCVELDAYHKDLDLIVLPQHIVNQDLLGVIGPNKLLTRIGVGHAYNDPKELLQAFEKNKEKFQLASVKSTSRPILVVLGGDAPTSTGTWRLFTTAQADLFGKYIGKLAKAQNNPVYVTNGPRTGKHCVGQYQDEKKSCQAQDGVSFAFLQGLKKIIDDEIQVRFFDFRNGERVWGAFRWLHINGRISKIFLPGESTSMCSEVMDDMEGKSAKSWNITIHYGMNEGHYEGVLSMKQATGCEVVKITQTRVESTNLGVSDNHTPPKCRSDINQKVFEDLEKLSHKSVRRPIKAQPYARQMCTKMCTII